MFHFCTRFSPVIQVVDSPTLKWNTPQWMPPIYQSMRPTPPEWTPRLSPGCPFLHHSMEMGINLVEHYPYPLIEQTTLKMKIFWPLPNFPGFPDFGLESSICLEIIGALKRIQFYNWSKSFKQQLILIKINVKGGNLIHFICSHERRLYYYHLKSGTKWFEENNRVGLFSTLFQKCHITGGGYVTYV